MGSTSVFHWVTGFEFGKKRTLQPGRGARLLCEEAEKLRKQIPCQPARIESSQEKVERLAIPFFHPQSRSPSAANWITAALVRQDFRTLAVCLALAQLQQRHRLLNLYTARSPGGADGGRRAPSSHGNPDRWARKVSARTSASTPSLAVGEKRCKVSLLLSGSWLQVPLPSHCFPSLPSPTCRKR